MLLSPTTEVGENNWRTQKIISAFHLKKPLSGAMFCLRPKKSDRLLKNVPTVIFFFFFFFAHEEKKKELIHGPPRTIPLPGFYFHQGFPRLAFGSFLLPKSFWTPRTKR